MSRITQSQPMRANSRETIGSGICCQMPTMIGLTRASFGVFAIGCSVTSWSVQTWTAFPGAARKLTTPSARRCSMVSWPGIRVTRWMVSARQPHANLDAFHRNVRQLLLKIHQAEQVAVPLGLVEYGHLDGRGRRRLRNADRRPASAPGSGTCRPSRRRSRWRRPSTPRVPGRNG